MIEESTVNVDGARVFYRRIAGEGAPIVFVHGNPTHSGDRMPFLRRLDRHWPWVERPALVDRIVEFIEAT